MCALEGLRNSLSRHYSTIRATLQLGLFKCSIICINIPYTLNIPPKTKTNTNQRSKRRRLRRHPTGRLWFRYLLGLLPQRCCGVPLLSKLPGGYPERQSPAANPWTLSRALLRLAGLGKLLPGTAGVRRVAGAGGGRDGGRRAGEPRAAEKPRGAVAKTETWAAKTGRHRKTSSA